MLVYPKRRKRERRPDQPDLTIQHRGAHFEYSMRGAAPSIPHLARDPLSIVAPDRREVPTVTAACLLARRSDLLVTPFDETYWYGSEDWDLCLRLSDLGKIIVDERAVLFHREFGTQDKYLDKDSGAAMNRNHLWFNGLWGPAVMRKLRSEVTGPQTAWFFRGDQAPIGLSDSRIRTHRGSHSPRDSASKLEKPAGMSAMKRENDVMSLSPWPRPKMSTGSVALTRRWRS